MDIEKLIESAEHCDLGDCANCPSCDRVCCKERTMGELAREVKRLQAENEKLRAELQKSEHDNVNLTGELAKVAAELDDLRAQWDMYGGDVGITAVYKELEQVKREKDAAASDLESVMAYRGDNLDTCQFCKNGQCHVRGGTKQCLPQWRGQKEG